MGFAQLFESHFADQNIELISQNELNVTEAEETGMTFEANAILKARNACEQTGLPALADDSGLEVDALQGEPGIPDELRTARFRCVLVYMRSADDPEPQVFEGSWEGRITQKNDKATLSNKTKQKKNKG